MKRNELVLYVFETNQGYTYIAKSSSTIDDKVVLKEWTGYPTSSLEASVGEKRRFYGGAYKDIKEVVFDFYIVSEQEDKVLQVRKIGKDEIKKAYWVKGHYDKVTTRPLNFYDIEIGLLSDSFDPFPKGK